MTSGKGPWSMTLIVHGFPNEICALRFEWAWTYPHASRRLRHLFPAQFKATGNKETRFDYCVRVMLSMINTRPWDRLPLTIRWLDINFRRDFLPALQPPLHMPVTTGWIKCTKLKDDLGKSNRYAKGKVGKTKGKSKQSQKAGGGNGKVGAKCVDRGKISIDDSSSESSNGQSDVDDDPDDDEMMYRQSSSLCALCRRSFVKSDATLRCLVPSCDAEFHILCLSKHFLQIEEGAGFTERKSRIIPVMGNCPLCRTELLWGDLIRFKRGCYRKELEAAVATATSGGGTENYDDHWTVLLSQR